MRPIQLTLAGLQSYREKQEIDFTALCDSGVFGIFGPTGSGKSSILDAMTLALYGKVERAVNGTQGIMNHAEKSLSVSFTFELSSASGQERYKVERQYKRNGDVSVTGTVARLIRQRPEGDEVLADKQSEVNAEVEALLGLSMSDFTRAVVLPQGKFAEFLSLKGSERRQMLQRLFRLERYGDELLARLSRQSKQVEQRIKELAAEQQGLGDASAEALAQVGEVLRVAEQEAASRRTELASCELRFAEANELRGWLLEQAQVEARWADLCSRADEASSWEQRIKLAEQAAALRPYLEQLEYADAERKSAATGLEASLLAHGTAAARHEEAKRSHAAADELLKREEPGWILRIEQYKQALQLERDMRELKQAFELGAEQIVLAEGEGKAKASALQEKKQLYDRALARQTDLKSELQQLDIPRERKLTLQQAAQEQGRIRLLDEQLASLHTQWDQVRTDREKRKQQLEELELSLRHEQTWAQSALPPITDGLFRLRAADRELTGWLKDRLPKLGEQLRIQRRERDQALIATRLAEHLHDGEPCPVCGSEHHPAPKPIGDVSAEPIDEQEEQKLGILIDQVRELQAALRQSMQHAVDWTKRTAELATVEVPTVAQDETAAAAEAWDSEGSDRLGMYGERFSALRALVEREAALLKEAFAELEAWASKLDRLRTQHHQAEAEYRAAANTALQTEKRLREAKDESQARREAWRSTFVDLTWERVEDELRELQEREQRADELRVRLDKSVQYIDETARALQVCQEEAHAADRKMQEVTLKQQALQERLHERKEQYRQRVGEASAASLLGDAEKALAQLQAAAQHASELLEQSRQAFDAAAQSLSAAKQADVQAESAWVKAKGQWERAISEAPLQNEEQVKVHLLAMDEVEALRSRLRDYREQEVKLAQEKEQLNQRIQGRSQSQEEWQTCEQQLQEAKQADEEALRVKARAERDAEQLRSRHERWSELETLRRIDQELAERLSKLQAVFRGNAFVEYMAEEQLYQVSRAASERLGDLTRQRYALEVDSTGGFIIRDDANGGVRRPVHTLSGGETFLTSLALALALSAQIQLRGQYPLEFFFLDEGFGTLDPDLLDTVVASLEKLHMNRLSVGVISHVPELRARLPKKLAVIPADASGTGSRVSLELL